MPSCWSMKLILFWVSTVKVSRRLEVIRQMGERWRKHLLGLVIGVRIVRCLCMRCCIKRVLSSESSWCRGNRSRSSWSGNKSTHSAPSVRSRRAPVTHHLPRWTTFQKQQSEASNSDLDNMAIPSCSQTACVNQKSSTPTWSSSRKPETKRWWKWD